MSSSQSAITENELLRLCRNWKTEELFGSLTLRFEGGNIYTIEEHRTFKKSDLDYLDKSETKN